MSLNTTLRALYQGQRHDVYPKTTIARVDGLSSRLSTIEEGKAEKVHTHIGSQIYVKSEELGNTLDVWATSIENELSDLAGGLQYKGVFTNDATLQALLEDTTSKAGSYFVYNGSSAYTIPASLGGKTITIVYGDDGSSTERVIEKNDYVVLNEKLTDEYKISIINNTHGSATTSKEGLVKLATGASTGNEVITAGVLNNKKATTSAYGIVKLATSSETSGDNVITAGVLNSKLPTSATTTAEGLVKLATVASTGNEVITASVLNAKDYQPAGSYANLGDNNVFTGTNTFSNDVLLNHTASGKKVQINIGQQGSANIVVTPGGNPEQQETTFLLYPTYAGGTETIIHTGNISLYAEKGMPLLTSAQESSFTAENVIYAVLDA